MQFSARLPRLIIISLVLLIAGEVYLLFVRSDVQWRARVIVQKSLGGIPELTWPRTIQVIMPPSVYGESGALRTGFITHSQIEEPGPCPVLWQTPIGEFWGRLKDEAALELLLAEQLVEREYDQERAGVSPGDIVLDVGSHLGTFTRFALNRGAKKVVGFEPEPVNATCFKRTFAQEIRSGRVVLIEAAAWHSTGTLNFQKNAPATGRVKDEGWSNNWDSSTEEFEVRAVTIDDQIRSLALARVDLIKMDIEGAERDALMGARETLGQFAPKLMICAYHRKDDRMVIPRVVMGANSSYRMVSGEQQIYFFRPD